MAACWGVLPNCSLFYFFLAEGGADVSENRTTLGGSHHRAEGGHAFQLVAFRDDFQEFGVWFREAGMVIAEIGGAARDAAAIRLMTGDAVEAVGFFAGRANDIG